MPKGKYDHSKNLSLFKRGHKVNLGSKRSLETKKRLSLSKMGAKNPMFGKKWSDDYRKDIVPKLRGRKLSKATKNKIGEANKDEKHPLWKGEDVSVAAKHQWIARKYGKPRYCEHCKRTDKKKYEWANKDHKYCRVVKDYKRLCTSCHIKYDLDFNNRKSNF